ncbi:MAG TPA: CoA transferase [Candidatus Binataceae bacterium]|nr:CoA transferase [Candidatus Binataceae bacterium]
MARQALEELTVIEYAEMVSGPMCGKMFADMGARVIKLEPPGCGDAARARPPFVDDEPHPERSGFFFYLNTSKKSVTLDPAQPSGAELFRKLIADADILIENRPPGFLEKLGLGYEALHALNPRLIVVSISPFGQSGPYRDWKGGELIEWGMSLAGNNTPTLVDDPERENPLKAPGHPAEMLGAANAAAAAMFALFQRDATGEGQWIDAPCWQAAATTAKIEMAVWSYVGLPFSRLRKNVSVGLEPLPCRDGYVYTLWAADTHWKALKQLLGNPESLAIEVFDTLAGRHENDDVLRPLVREELARHDMEELVREGQKLGLTIGPVHTVAQASEHPHLLARDAFVEIDHPSAGRQKYPHHLVSMTATPPTPTRAPLLGEHNGEVYGALGLSLLEQQGLRSAGVI